MFTLDINQVKKRRDVLLPKRVEIFFVDDKGSHRCDVNFDKSGDATFYKDGKWRPLSEVQSKQRILTMLDSIQTYSCSVPLS